YPVIGRAKRYDLFDRLESHSPRADDIQRHAIRHIRQVSLAMLLATPSLGSFNEFQQETPRVRPDYFCVTASHETNPAMPAPPQSPQGFRHSVPHLYLARPWYRSQCPKTS